MKKAFNTLTNEELCTLTEDQLSEYLDLEVVAQGKPLIPDALPQPEPTQVIPDTEIYVLEQWNDLALDKGTADRLMQILESTYLRRLDYTKKIQPVELLEDHYSPRISVVRTESEELKARLAPQRALLKSEWDNYREHEALRQEAFEAREKILEAMSARVASARTEMRNIERLRADWDKYLKLAGYSRAVAKNFFVDRYSAEVFDQLMEAEQ